MDLGFGYNINKLYRKALKAAREKRKREEERLKQERAYELALQREKAKRSLYETALTGQYGLAREKLSNLGALQRAKLMYGPESIRAKEFEWEKQKYRTEKPWEQFVKARNLALERKRLEQAGIMKGTLPIYDEMGTKIGEQPYFYKVELPEGGSPYARPIPIRTPDNKIVGYTETPSQIRKVEPQPISPVSYLNTPSISRPPSAISRPATISAEDKYSVTRYLPKGKPSYMSVTSRPKTAVAQEKVSEQPQRRMTVRDLIGKTIEAALPSRTRAEERARVLAQYGSEQLAPLQSLSYENIKKTLKKTGKKIKNIPYRIGDIELPFYIPRY